MATSVTLPRLGESVTEGTITRWLKQEGDWVDEDELLVEISTDKIDTELPSPTAGILLKIAVREDQTVEVGTEIAVIDETAANPREAGRTPPPTEARIHPPVAPIPVPAAEPGDAEKTIEPQPATAARHQSGEKRDDGRREERDRSGFLSPLVRKLASEHGVDLSQVRGTGEGGRTTKKDVLDFVQRHATSPSSAPQGAPAESTATQGVPEPPPTPAFAVPRGRTQDIPFTRIRKAIAEHMTRSRRTAAHVTDIAEVDMTSVARLRDRVKDAFGRTEGFSLTYLPFIARATVEALRAFPQFNVHLGEDTATLFSDVNLGIAVGRDEGLIVPVVKNADGLNLIGLARAIHDVAARARTKGALTPDDVAGGTFTITNFGAFGAVMDTPIINQPQAAILGVGAVVKRPAVVTFDGEDVIAIRHKMYLCLTYDHRWIDGHIAVQFNAKLRDILENEDFGDEFGPIDS